MKQGVVEHMEACNHMWKVLFEAGYHSGGWDAKTDKTAIVTGENPNRRIVGYMNRASLEIEWLEEPETPLIF